MIRENVLEGEHRTFDLFSYTIPKAFLDSLQAGRMNGFAWSYCSLTVSGANRRRKVAKGLCLKFYGKETGVCWGP